MIEINLIPDVKRELIKAQRTRSVVITISIIVSIISIAAVAILAVYIFSVQLIRGNLLDSAIKDENAKLTKVEDLSKMLTIQNQLTKISELNNNKKITSRIFNMLDNINPPAPNDIAMTSISVDTSLQSVSIEGQAAVGYSALEIFKKTIAGAKVKYTDGEGKQQYADLASNISTKDVSYGEDSSGAKVLRFSVDFTYTPELFALISKDESVVITVNGNVTDSYQGVPRSIFTDRATDIVGGN